MSTRDKSAEREICRLMREALGVAAVPNVMKS